MSGSVFVYKNDAMVRVPKDQVHFCKENITAKDLPCICVTGRRDAALSCVAMDYFEDEGEFLVDFNPNKIFSTTLFDEAKLPSEIGVPVSTDQKGRLIKTQGGEPVVGLYLGKKGNAVLFKLLGIPNR